MEKFAKDGEMSCLENPTKKESSGGYSYSAALRLDSKRLPLSPQPSDDPLDPLNWKPWLKLVVLLYSRHHNSIHAPAFHLDGTRDTVPAYAAQARLSPFQILDA